MGFVACLSLTRFIFHFLKTEIRHHFGKGSFFLLFKDTHFGFSYPMGKSVCGSFWSPLVLTNLINTLNYIYRGPWLNEKPDAICEVKQHRDLIWVDISKSQPEFGILLNVLVNILLAGTSANECLINIQLLYTSDLQLQMITLTQFNLEWRSKWQLSP